MAVFSCYVFVWDNRICLLLAMVPPGKRIVYTRPLANRLRVILLFLEMQFDLLQVAICLVFNFPHFSSPSLSKASFTGVPLLLPSVSIVSTKVVQCEAELLYK
jgi:hypothetical protein